MQLAAFLGDEIMSFSKRWFDYVDDNGNTWGILRDESNVRLVNPVGDVGAPTATNPLPRGYEPRTVTLQAPDGAIRHIPVLKAAAYSPIVNGQAFIEGSYDSEAAGTVLNVIYKTGEKIRRQPKVIDTGMIDGTQP